MRMCGVVEDMRKLGNEEEVDKEAGRGGLFKQGRKWLRTISSGAVELGGGIMSKHERRKKEDTRNRPSIVPPPPPGAPLPNNNILLRPPSREVEGIELRGNPMHGDNIAGVVKKANDTRHLDKALSRGVQGESDHEGQRLARKWGESATEKEAAAILAAQVSEEEWIAHVDPDSGDPYWESSKTGETQWEAPDDSR